MIPRKKLLRAETLHGYDENDGTTMYTHIYIIILIKIRRQALRNIHV